MASFAKKLINMDIRPQVLRLLAASSIIGMCFQNCGLNGQISSEIQGASSANSNGGAQGFTINIPFTAGTDSSYFVSDPTRVQLLGGVAQLTPLSTTTDNNNNTSTGFGSSVLTGVQWDATNSYVRLNTATNNSKLDSSWAPLWASLVGYWTFDSTLATIVNGAAVASVVGPALTANNPNGTGLSYVAGKMNQALQLDGVDDYLSGSDATLPAGSAAKSMCAWGSTTTIAAGYAWIVSYGTAVTNESVFIGRNGSDLHVGGYGNELVVPGFWAPNKWNHICLTYGGSTGKVYANGALIASAAKPWSVILSALRIGRQVNTNAEFWGGMIDDVGIWSATLSDAQVATLYSRQSAKYAGYFTSRVMDAGAAQTWTSIAATTTLPFGKELAPSSANEGYSANAAALTKSLVGVWHLNEPAGTTGTGGASDHSGNNNNATVVGGVTLGGPGVFASAAQVDGATTSYISAPGIFPSGSMGAYTKSAWINLSSLTSSCNTFSSGTSGHLLWAPGSACGTNNFSNKLSAGHNGVWNSVQDPTPLIANNWYHVVLTYDPNVAGGTMILYKDGVKVASAASIAPQTDSSFYVVGGATGFTGGVDESALWSRALSAGEVVQLYRRGANRVKYQVRSCGDATCSTNPIWQGPDNTANSYFSELYNTTKNVLGGSVLGTSPTLTFSNFTGLILTANRYFQYRAFLEVDEANALCIYGGVANTCSPELQSVNLGPNHFDTKVQYIVSSASIGATYQSLSGFTETLGPNLCASGTKYALSSDGTNFYYWNGSAWATSTDSSTASPASVIGANIASFPTAAGKTGANQTKVFLSSNGSTPCEVDNIQISGQR